MKTAYRILIPLLLAAAVMAGCKAREVTVMKYRYTPVIEASKYAAYKDVPVLIEYVTNRANDTVMFGYRDSQRRIWYMTDSLLEQYVKYSLEKALRHAGMKVNSTWVTPDDFHLRIELYSMTAQHVAFRLAVLQNGTEKYSTEIEARVTPAPAEWKSDEELQRYAFSLMDAMAASILQDKGVENTMGRKN